MTSQEHRLPAATRLGRYALTVADLDDVAAWYRTVVGLVAVAREEDSITLGVEGTPLLVLKASEDGVKRPPNAAGLFHAAIRVPSRAALGDALERIQTNARLAGAADHGVSEALYLTDPAGNGVEIYRDYPQKEWPVGPDDEIQLPTERLDLEAIAQASRGHERAPPGTDLGHIHLEVQSLAATKSFYVNTLGFDQKTSIPGATFFAAGDYHHHVGANVWGNRSEPAAGDGLAWFEIILPDTTALETLRGRLEKSDIPIQATSKGFGVADPDGIRIRCRIED